MSQEAVSERVAVVAYLLSRASTFAKRGEDQRAAGASEAEVDASYAKANALGSAAHLIESGMHINQRKAPSVGEQIRETTQAYGIRATDIPHPSRSELFAALEDFLLQVIRGTPVPTMGALESKARTILTLTQARSQLAGAAP